MAFAQNRLVQPWKLRTKVGVRFTRFVGVAAASLATSEILLAICNGVFHMTVDAGRAGEPRSAARWSATC